MFLKTALIIHYQVEIEFICFATLLFQMPWYFLQEVQSRFPDGLPPLDPVEDMGIKERGLVECVRVCRILLSTAVLIRFS